MNALDHKKIDISSKSTWGREGSRKIFQHVIRIKDDLKYLISRIKAQLTRIPEGLKLIPEIELSISNHKSANQYVLTFKFHSTKDCEGELLEIIISFGDPYLKLADLVQIPSERDKN